MRKLTLICISFSFAVFICNYLFQQNVELGIMLFSVGSGILLLIKGNNNIRFFSAGLALLSFAFGIAVFYSGVLLKKEPASDLNGKTVKITGKVLSYPIAYDNYSKIDIILKTDNAPGLNAILYDSDDVISELEPGDVFTCIGRVKAADIRYGQDYDLYNSKDIFLTANYDSDFNVLNKSFFSIRVVAAHISEAISTIVDKVFSSKYSPFMKSLMLGDKSDFYNDDADYIALSRAGLMHIVAVSGMHVAFVVTIIQMIFGTGRTSSIIGIILVWCFVFVSGASPSSVRAGVMQSILLLAPLVKKENDPITSLSFALAVILLINPFSCASISLQLSFSAMAGLILFADKIRNAFTVQLRNTILNGIVNFVMDVFSASIAVMVFSLPLTAIHFGTVVILSPFSNLLSLWCVSFCFGGGYLSILAGSIFLPIGKAFAVVVSLLVRYLFAVSSIISSYKYAVVYSENILVVVWFAFTYLLIFLCILCKGNLGIRIVCVISASVIVLTVFLLETELYYNRSPGFFTAVDVGQGQCICAISGDRTIVVDCGTSNYGLGNAGEKAAAYLRSRGRDSVDFLIITHLHSDHVNGIVRLLYSIPVKKVIVAETVHDDEGYLNIISETAESLDTEIIIISGDTLISTGNFSVELYCPESDELQNESSMFTKVSVKDYDMLITGDAPKSVEKRFVDEHPEVNAEVLVVGHHGSRYSSSGYLLNNVSGDTALISVGYNLYGHPTGETLDRLAAYGFSEIYRTDLNGTIEIPVGVE